LVPNKTQTKIKEEKCKKADQKNCMLLLAETMDWNTLKSLTLPLQATNLNATITIQH